MCRAVRCIAAAHPRWGCFGLGLASFAADTRQSSGEKAGGDIDFAAFYILPVPSSLSAKWRRVKIGSLPPFSPSRRMPPNHPRRVRAWHLWSSSARCSGSRPHSRSLRRRSRRLRGDTRRNASSAGYRLLALRRVSPRIRRTASPHVAQFGTRPLVPCLTFHKARFCS